MISGSGNDIVREYEMSAGKLELVKELMAMQEVPILVELREDSIRVHGTELEQKVFKSFVEMIDPDDTRRWDRNPDVAAVLVDGSTGGHGEAFDPETLAAFRNELTKPLIIAGGLTAENVGAAIATLRAQHHVTLAFGASEQELCEKIRNCHILVFRSGVQITARVLQSAPDLSLLIRAGSGLDNLDLACAESLGLKLIRVPEPGARAVAELSFGLMLMLARQMRPADRLLREGHWAKSEITGLPS